MAHSCANIVAPLGCKNLFDDHHKSKKGYIHINFQGKKLNNNSKFFNKKPLLSCKASNNNGGEPLATLTTSSLDQAVAPPLTVPQQPLPVDGSTMSVVLAPGLEPATISIPDHVKRSDFPADFFFGASSSALQTEGNGKEGGRAPSTWDYMIATGGNNMCIDSYSLYQLDVQLLKDMGMTAYRFSISWSRILPYAGEDNSIINTQGIEFYNNLINDLITNGITPFVTLFHFDLPVTVQNKYSGFLNEDIIDDFKYYADVCFKNFGDRVKYWITVNEPYNFGSFGFKTGLPADNKIEPSPYVATHNIILTHAATVQHYRDNYQTDQGGKIGISLSSLWFEPYDKKNGHHVKAQKASLEMMLGWYMDPLYKGEYPKLLQEFVIGGLPTFTPQQKEMVKGSYDFIGINYYTSRYVTFSQTSTVDVNLGQCRIEFIEQSVKNKEGTPIGPPAPESDYIYVVPTGLRDLLLYIKHKYNNPDVYVTENGVSSTPTITNSIRNLIAERNIKELEAALLDEFRIKDIGEYLYNLREALADISASDDDGTRGPTNVKGYFVWALVDNMEVGSGYKVRFGLGYADYFDRHRRYPKASAHWFSHFLTSNKTPSNGPPNTN